VCDDSNRLDSDYCAADCTRAGQVAAGWDHSCALKADGSVRCWGSTLAVIDGAPTSALTAIAAGNGFSCGIVAADQSLICWGVDTSGIASTPPGTYQQVSAGDTHACALSTTGTIECWGSGPYGQLNKPAGVFTSISVGASHSCAMSSTGASTCWGNNGYGEVDAYSGTFAAIDAGGLYKRAILQSDNSLDCWGRDISLQVTNKPAGAFSQVSTGYFTPARCRALVP
jgi:alpha-tubulin suppressor-like RCC1 family protein